LGNRAVDPSATSEFAELRPIYFDYDSYQIRPDQSAVLDSNAAWLMQKRPVGAHQHRGALRRTRHEEYNMSLSEFRASINSDGIGQAGRFRRSDERDPVWGRAPGGCRPQ
jgi:hypothetical protein